MFATQGIATPMEAREEAGLSELSPPGPESGLLPEGSLVEISGPEARIQAARIIAENGHAAAWIERDLESLPNEVLRTRMNFDRVLFLNGQRDSAWAVASMIRSRCFPIVVFAAPYENEKFLRRLRRLARNAGVTVFLLRDEPCFSWAIRVQLRARKDGLEVLRWRKQ